MGLRLGFALAFLSASWFFFLHSRDCLYCDFREGVGKIRYIGVQGPWMQRTASATEVCDSETQKTNRETKTGLLSCVVSDSPM
jgi:hypothetical protein